MKKLTNKTTKDEVKSITYNMNKKNDTGYLPRAAQGHSTFPLQYNYSFTQYLRYWLHDIRLKRVQPQTGTQNQWIIETIIIPCCKNDIPIRQVNAPFLNEVLKSCCQYSKSAAAECKKILNIVFKDALAENVILYDPMPDTKPVKYNPPYVKVLNHTEIKTFLEHAQFTPYYFEFMMALFVGLRKGEILGLKSSDFDKDNRTVTVNRQLTRDYAYIDGVYKQLATQSIKPPKSLKAHRTLRIPDIIFDLLEHREYQIKSYGSSLAKEGFLSLNENRGFISEATLNAVIDRYCIHYLQEKFTMHGLRHTFATLLLENNCPIDMISDVLGHESITTTLDIYCGIINGYSDIGEFISKQFHPSTTLKMVEGGY